MNNELHAHVSTFARDCDGGHGNEYIATFNDAEREEARAANGVNDFSELHFQQRIMGNIVSLHVEEGFTGKLEITAFGLSYGEPTEEGHRSAEVIWCRDDCDDTAHSVYDEYAEMMGY